MLTNKIIQLEKTNLILSQLTPIEKISKYLIYKYKELNSLSLVLPYNKHTLASYLGISLKDLKEALAILKNKNIIASKGYVYNILNLTLLTSIINNEKESTVIL